MKQWLLRLKKQNKTILQSWTMSHDWKRGFVCEVNCFHDYQSLVTACFIALPPAKILNTVGDLKKKCQCQICCWFSAWHQNSADPWRPGLYMTSWGAIGIGYQDISRGCSESPGSCEWSLGGSELFQLVYKHPVTNSCHQRLSSDHWW